MDGEYYLGTGIQPQFETSLSWGTDFQPANYSDQLMLSGDQYANFESALSSLVSSPAASSSAISGDSVAIRELIGKMGTICNSGEISPPFFPATPYFHGGNNTANNSRYSSPLSSPSKLNVPMIDQFVKENFPVLGNSMSHSLPSLSSDPGFAERAAKFSCFGSRSSNCKQSFTGVTRIANGGARNQQLISNPIRNRVR